MNVWVLIVFITVNGQFNQILTPGAAISAEKCEQGKSDFTADLGGLPSGAKLTMVCAPMTIPELKPAVQHETKPAPGQTEI